MFIRVSVLKKVLEADAAFGYPSLGLLDAPEVVRLRVLGCWTLNGSHGKLCVVHISL